jgi:hypothetical protein
MNEFFVKIDPMTARDDGKGESWHRNFQFRRPDMAFRVHAFGAVLGLVLSSLLSPDGVSTAANTARLAQP